MCHNIVMKNIRIKNPSKMILILINLVLIISTMIITIRGYFFGAGSGQVGNYIIGVDYFKPYTMDSNIFCAISAFILVIYLLVYRKNILPKWIEVLYMMSTTCLLLTILIVAIFLAPMRVLEGGSYFMAFSDDMFFFHLVNPLIAIVSYTMLLKNHKMNKIDILFGTIPTIIYSTIYFVLVVIVGVWDDFYNFTLGGHYIFSPLIIFIILLLVYSLSYLLNKWHNRRISIF